MGVGVQHLALEVAGERHGVVFVFEWKTEAGLLAGQKTDLEQNRFSCVNRGHYSLTHSKTARSPDISRKRADFPYS